MPGPDFDTADFNDEMSNPDRFNDCTCDMWPGGEPHRHLSGLREELQDATGQAVGNVVIGNTDEPPPPLEDE